MLTLIILVGLAAAKAGDVGIQLVQQARGQKGGSSAGTVQNGAPGGIRTPDLQLRRLPLYPSELQARDCSLP